MREKTLFQLGKRLGLCAAMVRPGCRLADIGTDHGYLPVWLAKTGAILSAVAADVREGPLQSARQNIERYGVQDQVTARLSDGLDLVSAQEADDIVIAGMGGGLMIRILKEGEDVVRTLKECILQPQSEIEKVRAFLLEEGFLFIAEDMVEEDGKYYPMMKVVPPKKNAQQAGADRTETGQTASDRERTDRADEGPGSGSGNTVRCDEPWDEAELRYGKYLLQNRHPVLRRYLEREQRIKRDILKGLKGQDSPRILMRRRELEKELKYIEKGLTRYAV